ncbi:MAG TPA: aldehyde dehydrogenase family protein [Candidatus Kapabacteria bacterium]|nr:aldehyde dehydrogenase family protein [Candidatus Kapabacteria bacterium]
MISTTQDPFIGGKNKSGNAGLREVIDPFDGSKVGVVTYADQVQAAGAVANSAEVFSRFRTTPAHIRAEILSRTSALIAERRDELALMIVRESGKPITLAKVEVDRAVFTFKAASEATHRAGEGEVIDMSVSATGVGRTGSFRYFPIGIVLAITPFNYPLNLVAHKVAPAIAAGNTVVLKPAPQTPLTSLMLSEMMQEAGLPDGVLNVVPCENEVAESLVRDDRIAMVSFTGSDAVGWKLKSIAGRAKVALELGGNGCVIVNDANSLEQVSQTLARAAFNYAGQICISLQNLLVRREHFPAMLEMMISQAKQIEVADPKLAETILGPMISEAAAQKVESWIDAAVKAGATRHCGAYQAPNSITPTVLSNVAHDSELYQNEAFAPVVVIQPYDSFDEAISLVNASKYGLQAGLFSNDIRLIHQAYEQLEVGGLIVNDANSFRLDTMPYGGIKSSGIGRVGIIFAMREMSEVKMLVIRP